MTEKFRITYATLSADNEELQASYDAAAERMKAELGQEYPVIVNGEERWHDEKYDEPSPIDHDVIIGHFSQATAQDVDDAVKAAKAFSLEWERMGWRKRVDILRNVADVMEDRLFDLADGRRPAGYVVASESSKAFDDPGIFVEIPLVNLIRRRVKAWREAGYPVRTGSEP